MRKRFPRWFYTTPGTVLWLAFIWLTFGCVDMLIKGGAPRWFSVLTVVVSCVAIVITYIQVTGVGASASASAAPPAFVPYRAYLVIHFDIKQTPPVATFVDIYSASARHLTSIGGEGKADLYVAEGNSYHEASESLERIAPLYFPWVVPLMTRSR